MPRGPSKKTPFEDMDAELKETIEAMSDDEIKAKMSAVSIAEHENREAKKNDQDLAEKLVQAKEAGAQYREATKANRLTIEFCYSLLHARGKV